MARTPVVVVVECPAGVPPAYPGALPGHTRVAGLSQAAPRDGSVVDGPSIRLSARKIQNRKSSQLLWRLVTRGRPFGRPGRVRNGISTTF